MKKSLFLLLSIVSTTSGLRMKAPEPTDAELIKTYIETDEEATKKDDDFGSDMID